MPGADSPPQPLGGRYRLEAELGSGGMGAVYRATDLTMRRPVAVKVIRGIDGVDIDDDVANRFLREAKNTARVQHEHIIEIYDFGRGEAGEMFLVMELLEGESLSARLRREPRLAPATGVHILRQMCAALHVAHASGIVHRDLKPANVVLIRRAGDDQYVKVLDFGVAKSYAPDQETELTHRGMLIGTLEYMAPEQITGAGVDGRSDIYSLGVLMYRLFAGRAPFLDATVPGLIHAHVNLLPAPMSELVPGIPRALDRVVLRCLAKRPEDRFGSMEELSRALLAALQPGDDLGLVDLEYHSGSAESDIYHSSETTEVGGGPGPEAGGGGGGRVAGQGARGGASALPSFDDATVRLARSDLAPARPLAGAVDDLGDTRSDEVVLDSTDFTGDLTHDRSRDPALGFDSADPTAVMSRDEAAHARNAASYVGDELSTAKRPAADRPLLPKECAMCRTLNPPHARACVACGVSLSPEEQEAVRARVAAPRPPSPVPPAMPLRSPLGVPRTPASASPPVSPSAAPPPGATPAFGPPPLAPSPSAPSPSRPPFGGPPRAPSPPPGVWGRLLTALGLRRR